jgi:hypothetical protein
MARTYLILIGLTFVGFGSWLLMDPEALSRLIGIHWETAAARTEIRAFYGGLELGIGLFLLGNGMRPQGVNVGLALIACALGGAGLARLGSLVQDGVEGWHMSAFMVLELAASVIALILMVRKPAKPGSTPHS